MAFFSPGVKFSEFVNGGFQQAGDQVVGVRSVDSEPLVNAIFNSPSAAGPVITITQTGHGFAPLTIVATDPNPPVQFIKAIASSPDTSNVVGIVTAVLDNDNFQMTTGVGFIVAGFVALTPEEPYYLSPFVAGEFTLTEPSALGQFSKTLFIALTTTTAIWRNDIGQPIS